MRQLSLIEPESTSATGFTSDDWETPDPIAQLMASLVLPADRRILEPSAGTGQIAKYLPKSTDHMVVCNEINSYRHARASSSNYHHWVNSDFLTGQFRQFDLVITNPPFSVASAFIGRGLDLLDRSYSNARLLFLLPNDFFQSIARNQAFQSLDCHIHHVYAIVNRIAYLREGKPERGRQIYDSCFDIRPGKTPASVTFWNF